jgi:hypothetical protein
MCYFVFFVYCIVLCIVVPLPPGTYPLAVNINNKICSELHSVNSQLPL